MPDCTYCEQRATGMYRYDEQGTPEKDKPLCEDHATTEQIHDPFNITKIRDLQTAT